MSFANVFVTVWCALILCTNVANSAPTFPSTIIKTVNVRENATLDQLVTDQVRATSTRALGYALERQTPFLLLYTFSVDSNTGNVRVIWPLDYEDRKSYLLLISATDSSGIAYHNLTVKVTDVNEPPEFYGFLYVKTKFSIADNAEIGTSVTTITANDPEKKTVTYAIASNEDFAIDDSTGVITSTSVMNRTETSSYSLQVTASDPTNLGRQLGITIDVNGALFLHGGFVSLLMLLALFIIH